MLYIDSDKNDIICNFLELNINRKVSRAISTSKLLIGFCCSTRNTFLYGIHFWTNIIPGIVTLVTN